MTCQREPHPQGKQGSSGALDDIDYTTSRRPQGSFVLPARSGRGGAGEQGSRGAGEQGSRGAERWQGEEAHVWVKNWTISRPPRFSRHEKERESKGDSDGVT